MAIVDQASLLTLALLYACVGHVVATGRVAGVIGKYFSLL